MSIYDNFYPGQLYLSDARNLLELYLSSSEDVLFDGAIYYDEEEEPHEVKIWVNWGGLNSVQIERRKELTGELLGEFMFVTVAQYIPRRRVTEDFDSVTFDGRFRRRKDGSQQMLIHNTGKKNLRIEFEDCDYQWTIVPGEAKRIIPFHPDGADFLKGN